MLSFFRLNRWNREEKLILSVDGVDIKHGFTTYYNKEVFLDRVMIEQSDRRIIAADSSKFCNNAFAKISDFWHNFLATVEKV